MASSVKFIWGDRDLLSAKKRVNVADHSPVKTGVHSAHAQKKPTNYANSHGFSCRTGRDKTQAVGRLYLGD